MSSNGLGVRVEVRIPTGADSFENQGSKFRPWGFEYDRTWWENFVRGNRKTAGKSSAMVGNFPLWRKKVFRCMDHLVLRHPSYMRGFTYLFSLLARRRICFRTHPTSRCDPMVRPLLLLAFVRSTPRWGGGGGHHC
jgi:hypothetical protein